MVAHEHTRRVDLRKREGEHCVRFGTGANWRAIPPCSLPSEGREFLTVAAACRPLYEDTRRGGVGLHGAPRIRAARAAGCDCVDGRCAIRVGSGRERRSARYGWCDCRASNSRGSFPRGVKARPAGPPPALPRSPVGRLCRAVPSPPDDLDSSPPRSQRLLTPLPSEKSSGLSSRKCLPAGDSNGRREPRRRPAVAGLRPWLPPGVRNVAGCVLRV